MSDPRGYFAPPTPSGPSFAQFVGIVQQMLQALNAQVAALQQLLGTRAAPQIVLAEIVAPAAPASGAIIYVDSSTHLLMAVDSVGHRVALT